MIKKVVFAFIFVFAVCGNSFSEGAEEANSLTEQVGKVNSDAEIVEEDEVFPLFEENECAVPPNLLQKALIFLTGTAQNHWTVENSLKFYAPLVAACYFSQLSASNGDFLDINNRTNSHLKKTAAFYLAVEALQHYLTDKRVLSPQDAASHSLSSTWLSDHASLGNLFKKDEFRYKLSIKSSNPSAYFYYLKRLSMRLSRGAKTSELLADIEAECKKLSIESGISYGSVPENENFLLLESPKTIYLELVRSVLGRIFAVDCRKYDDYAWLILGIDFDLKRAFLHYATKGEGTEESRDFAHDPVSEKVFWLVTSLRLLLAGLYLQSYFFNRIIIPYSTIQKLSPALQDRCYELMWLNKTQL